MQNAEIFAEICKAPGGARAIATMTFDDGLVKTALALSELTEKYNCMASLMLTTHRLNDETAAMWNELFDKGYLRPESHSHAHMYLNNAHPENLTEEIITSEVDYSFDLLKKYFPKYDCLGFAIPYSSYAPQAMKHVKGSCYAVRSGTCVLAYEHVRGKMQSLDPTFDGELGSWYSTLSVRMMGEKAVYKDMLTPENIMGYLDQCVENEGWFISVAHGIVEGENLDITVQDLGRIMKRMQELSEQGALWVADFSTAVKYIRERQNTELELIESQDGALKLKMSMRERTEDGLPLSHDVFNMPLTVRLELSNRASGVEYTVGGESRTASVVRSGDKAYAYIDILPWEEASARIF